jgi:hypothetical protein
MGITLDSEKVLFKGGYMRNLQPDYTKVRVYLELNSPDYKENTSLFLSRAREFGVEAVCEIALTANQTAIEVIARRNMIHEHIVPLIEEFLPNAFVTLEAVCAFRTKRSADHPVYGKIQSGSNKVVRLHQ